MIHVLFVVLGSSLNAYANVSVPCLSKVYCQGPLLHTVQLSRIFNDSKSFVDMKMKYDYNITLRNFKTFMAATNNTPSTDKTKVFVGDNFEEGNELEKWIPADYKENPGFIANISDPVIKEFARQLVELWPVLARKVKSEVKEHPHRYSFVPVPNGFIIPGGRFKEYYYWDSYWIIKGLLISEMYETARGMIDNFIYIIKNYGFVPNGGRIYYLNRSHPPLLTKMAMVYFKFTNNTKWLKENIQYLQHELLYWLEYRTIQLQKGGKIYTMAHYNAKGPGPRPESYAADFKTAQIYPNAEDKEQLYTDLKSAAESGWDFSSRWIFDSKGNNVANLSHVQTRRIVPVDLNSYLCDAFKSISYLYSELGDVNNTMYWRKMGLNWQKSVEEVLWDNDDGIWYDYDLKLNKTRKYFYPSNITPLWAGCFDEHKGPTLGKRVLHYLSDVGALTFPGGVAASLEQTGEQWDFPNSWAPLQSVLVQALERSKDPEAAAEAKRVALTWLKGNVEGFRESGEMFEKYDAVHPGKYGGGGEYVVQSGFGWSNGVALEFIYNYFNTDYSENEVK